MPRPPPTGRDRSPTSRNRSAADRAVVRGVLRLVRLLLVVALLAAVALAVTMYAPGALDVISEGPSPFASEPPPSDEAADRAPPGDPGETTYERGSVSISSGAVERAVHREVNERRADRGLEPLERDPTVASVARAHSADMRAREYFDHVNPDGEGPMDRFHAVASYCRGYGENIATTWVDTDVRPAGGGEVDRYESTEELAEGLVDQWMNSPSHRDAILEPAWDRGGVGIYLTDDGQVFATHNFCTEW